MGIFLIVVIILIAIILLQYNSLVKLKNNVKRSESGIDVYLNQRFDLIPNLVECVKAYSKHESQVFENIVKLRTEYNKTKDVNFEQASEINKNLNEILAIVEGYPELKTSEQYLNLQRSLVKVESQLQAARRIYNNDVTVYNTKLETVPTNIVANLFGFKSAELFEIEEYKRENINIESEK